MVVERSVRDHMMLASEVSCQATEANCFGPEVFSVGGGEDFV